MVKLPTLQPRGATIRGPQSSVSGGEVANVYQQIADAFGAWGGALEKKAQDDARIEGQSAVSRGENGELKVDLRPNFSEVNRTYNKVAMMDFTAKAELDARTTSSRLQQEAKGNPEAYRASWKAYQDQQLINAPDKEIRGPLRSIFEREGQLGLSGVMDQKYRSDMSMAKTTFLSSIEMKQNEMAALAFQGGTDTPAYRERQAEVRSLYSELSGNPVFQFSSEEADMKMKQMESRDMGEAMLGQAERSIQAGDLTQVNAMRQRILTDETLDLSPAERRQYAGMISDRVSGYKATVKANLEPLKDNAKERQKLWEQGVGLDDASDDDLISEIKKYDLAAGREYERQRSVQRKIRDFKRLGDTEQAAILEQNVANMNRPAPGRSRPVSVAPEMSGRMEQAMNHYIARGLSPVMAAGIVGNLVQESGLNTGARNPGDGTDGSDSIGVAQWNSDRAKALKSFAAARGASADDLSTQLDFVLHELETTEGAAYARLKAAKNVDEATAAIIGFERPQGWSAANPRGGHGWNNRLAMAMKAGEMKGLTGEALAVSQMAGVPPELIKEQQEEVKRDLTSDLPKYSDMLAKGNVPDQESLNLLSRQLALVDDQNLRQDYATVFRQSEAFNTAFASNPAAAESFLTSLETDAGINGASIAEAEVISSYRRGVEAREKAIKEDALGFGERARMIPVTPNFLDSDASSWGGAMQQAQRNVNTMRAAGAVGNISALRPAQEVEVSRIFQNGDPQQLQALTASITSLSPETLKATLSSPKYKEALKGAVLSNDPIRFNEAMSQLDSIAESAGWPYIEGTFGSDTADRLQDWQAKARYLSPDDAKEWLRLRNAPDWSQRTKPMVDQGAKAARETSFNSALEDVAGGLLRFDPSEPVDPEIRDEFMRDYASLVGMRNATYNDVGSAKSDAAKRMSSRWGATSAFGGLGGRLMLYPPEKSYPQIDGSHNWIRSEVEREITGPRGLAIENVSLISDVKTEGAIQRGEAPGYLISTIDPETGLRSLLTDDQGRVIRHTFDPASAQRQALTDAQEARRTRNDPWLVLPGGVTVGPLYPGGAQAEDLQNRQQRIDEIRGEQKSRMDKKRDIRQQIKTADIPGLPVPPEEQ